MCTPTTRINLECKSYLKIVASTVRSGVYPTTVSSLLCRHIKNYTIMTKDTLLQKMHSISTVVACMEY